MNRLPTVQSKLEYIRTNAELISDLELRVEMCNDLDTVIKSIEEIQSGEEPATLTRILDEARARVAVEVAGSSAQAEAIEKINQAGRFIDKIIAASAVPDEQMQLEFEPFEP